LKARRATASRRRIETRLLLRQAGQWFDYSYRWDEAQSRRDAGGGQGRRRKFGIKDRRAAVGCGDKPGVI
jgi:hypothetical protein